MQTAREPLHSRPRRRQWQCCRPFAACAGPPSCRDLIKQVRQCKTAAEERDVVAKESAALRQAFKEQDGTYRHRWGAQLTSRGCSSAVRSSMNWDVCVTPWLLA